MQSLTPNPKAQQFRVDTDFRSLKNFILSNIDSDSDQPDLSVEESVPLTESEDSQTIGSGLKGGDKPWTLPVEEPQTTQVNQIFLSPKPKPSAQKMLDAPEFIPSQPIQQTALFLTPNPKSSMQ